LKIETGGSDCGSALKASFLYRAEFFLKRNVAIKTRTRKMAEARRPSTETPTSAFEKRCDPGVETANNVKCVLVSNK